MECKHYFSIFFLSLSIKFIVEKDNKQDIPKYCNESTFLFRVFLSKQLKNLHNHLDSLIPQTKRGFLSQFFSQVYLILLLVIYYIDE